MNTRRLIAKSIRHNWRTHLGVILGSALAALVLTGALMVGDSVKATLRAQAEARVGEIGEALLCGERFVPWAAAPEKRPQVVARMFYPGADAAGVVLIHGSAVRGDGKARANRVQIVGVDEAFWKLSPGGMDPMDPMDTAKPGAVHPVHEVHPVHLNARLAVQLGARAGDEVLIKFEKPGALSKDAPLSGGDDVVVSLRLRIARVVGDAEFGRFALTSGQVPPHTAFIPLAALQEKLGVGEKVNVVLSAAYDAELEPTPLYLRFFDQAAKAVGAKPILTEQFSIKAGLVPPSPEDQSAKVHDAFARPRGISVEILQSMEAFGIRVTELPHRSGFELRSPRIFLEEPIVAAARANESGGAGLKPAAPGILPGASNVEGAPQRETPSRPNANAHTPTLHGPGSKPGPAGYKPTLPAPPPGIDSLTYFVNSLKLGDGGTVAATPATPYSFVTALDAPASGFVQAELSDNEIQITRWLADDLGAKPSDKITLRYFVMGERRELVEKARTFTILAPIIEMTEPRLDTSWMPDFPNIPDKDSFSKWKPGFPFDGKRIRKKDEDYWAQHRGTPKAFVNLKVGQEMWGNRWGNLTSIRYYGDTGVSPVPGTPTQPRTGGTPVPLLREQVERIAAFIEPEALGFRIVPLREQALAATDAPVDFGQLFTAFSVFLIAAAAVLTGLLFTFSIEQRAAEAGLLLAVGWTRRRVKKLFLREGTLLAVIGSVAGVAAAVLYTKAVLHGLAGAWSGATGGTTFLFSPTPLSCGIGLLAGVIVARLAMWLASRRIYIREAAALLAGAAESDTARPACANGEPQPGRAVSLSAATCLVATLALAAFSRGNPGMFFGAGALLLTGGLLFARHWLRRVSVGTGLESPADLAARNTTRRRGRSLATIAVLASGVFMVVAVHSFRKDSSADATRRDNGTGGFALMGESAAPIYEDLNSAKGRAAYALDDKIMQGVRVVQMRVRDGDDASCLNLNRAVQPRVLGVKPDDLDGHFQINEPKLSDPKVSWAVFFNPILSSAHFPNVDEEKGFIRAVVDANTLQWALKKKLGERLVVNNERGESAAVYVRATIAASILQGSVIIKEEDFISRFPNTAGYRFFLVDCPPEKMAEVREHLTKQLGDRGLELIPAAQRLAEFNAVENTYLSIFQVLGGLGMLLGSVGLGIVVARNVLERRREFGLLEAVGFTPRQLRGLVFAEHRWLIAGALGIGAVSALVAVWPGILQQGATFPWMSIGTLFAGMVIFAALSAWVATRVALRGTHLDALRSE